MPDDPNFAYDVLRPIAVVSGYMISMRLGWLLRDWLLKRPDGDDGKPKLLKNVKYRVLPRG